MTLVDTNLLVYATFTAAPEHARARAWLELQLSTDGAALCWPVLYSLWRLITSPRIAGAHAVSAATGWDVIRAYLAQPAVSLVRPGAQHAAVAEELSRSPGLRSDDVPDVEVAAIAIEHGLVLATHDHGFRRFAQIRLVDPLA